MLISFERGNYINMKKAKRILALLGSIVLCLMYLSTLIFAVSDNPAAMGLFKLSIAFTILIPVLLYVFLLFYRLSHKNDDDQNDQL